MLVPVPKTEEGESEVGGLELRKGLVLCPAKLFSAEEDLECINGFPEFVCAPEVAGFLCKNDEALARPEPRTSCVVLEDRDLVEPEFERESETAALPVNEESFAFTLDS